MKTTYSFLKRTCLFLALFCWFVPMNLMAQIAIGTGTVTLNYTNTSDPTAPVTNTFVLSNLSTPIASETCIAFGNTDWSGGIVLSQVEWSATIVPGIYEIELTYGTGSWGVKPLVSVYDGASKVTDIYSAPSGQTSGAWKGQADFSPAPMDVDLQDLTAGKTYTIRVTDEWGGGYGLCVGHISFTPKAGVNMAAFGQSADGGPTTLPDNGSNAINGITVTTNMELDLCNGRTYDYLFNNEGTDYVDISVGSDQIMTALALSILYDGSCSGGLYIQFCSSATYDAGSLVGSPILLDGLAFGDFYTYPPATASVSLPGGVIKSARIYRNGNCEWGTRLYRIEVEAEADECTSPLTASFAAGAGAVGDAPANMLACEGQSFTLPDANSLSKLFSAFDGWNDGSDTYDAGESYTMPAGGVSFTAQWVEDVTTIRIPSVTVLNSSNQSTSVPTTDYWDVTDDGINDVCLDMNQKTAEWNVFITPGIYDISTICAVPYWGIGYTLSVVDPQTGSQVLELFTEHTSGDGSTAIIRNLTNTFDLSCLVDGKRYIIRIQDTWPNCTLLAHDIIFSPQAPSLTTYERPVAPGEYGTVCIGYAVEHENISGATMFEIDEWSADGKTLTLSELGASEAMVAGRPYIFLASASTLSLGYDGSASEAPAGNHNGLIGSYTQEVIDIDDDNYIIFQNKLYLVDVLAYVGEHRAYIHKTDATPSPAPRRRVTLSVNGTQTTTGIDQLNSNSANGKFIKDGQLFIIRDGRTYNAQGIELK